MRFTTNGYSAHSLTCGALLSVMVALLAPCVPGAWAQQREVGEPASIDWKEGPATAALGSVAEIQVPPEYFRFAGRSDTIKLMELMENPTSGEELGLVMPNHGDWIVIFEYDPIGFVKDDEKEQLDANAMLKSIREGTEQTNKERRKRGWSTMKILGWEQPPRYDQETNNLVWAIRGESDQHAVVNYNTRRLGRGGVMSVTLVLDPEQLTATVPEFNKVMKGFSFTSGQRYSEFRSGDKVAQYGLTALITGGAAAVAVKTGALKWIWKAGVAAVLAIGAAIKGIFKRRQPT